MECQLLTQVKDSGGVTSVHHHWENFSGHLQAATTERL